MTFRLTVLGRCGSYPGEGDASSGYLLRTDSATVWLDAGSGTMANLQKHVALADVDAVILSHQHYDHWSDLEGFVVASKYGVQQFDAPPIYATGGVHEVAQSGISGHEADWNVVTAGDSITVGDISFSFAHARHPVETLAVRAEADGRVLIYTADTGPEFSLEVFGQPCHTALCEATGWAEHEGGSFSEFHLSARQAGHMAAAAEAERLLLTHVWPTLDLTRSETEASQTFSGPVTAVRTNESYEI